MKQYRYFALTEGKNPQEPTGLLRELETDSEYFLEYLDEDGQWVLDFELATYIFGESPNSVQVNDAAAREIARKIAPAKKFHLAGTEDDHDQSDHAPNRNGGGRSAKGEKQKELFPNLPSSYRPPDEGIKLPVSVNGWTPANENDQAVADAVIDAVGVSQGAIAQGFKVDNEKYESQIETVSFRADISTNEILDEARAEVLADLEQTERPEEVEKIKANPEEMKEAIQRKISDKLGDSVSSMTVKGKIFEKESGLPVGSFTRDFDLADRSVYHAYFFLDKDHQGTGIAKELFSNSVQLYDQLGIDRITTNADGDVGHYAWALYGFDWQSNYKRNEMVSQFQEYAADNDYVQGMGYEAKRDLVGDIEAIEHTWEMATFKLPDGTKIGKEFMLQNGDWDGELQLQGEHREILDAYLAKGKARKHAAIERPPNVPKSWVDQDSEEFHRDMFDQEEEMFEFIAQLKSKKSKKFHGDHDQDDHGNWADGKGGAKEIKRPDSYFNGWPAKDRELVALGDKIASYFDEPHLIDKVGESIPERQVEELLASRKNTEAAAIMRGGKLEHFWNGAESVVKIPDSVDLAGATLIHNHPLGASLSINDIVAASKDKLAEIRAVGRFDDATYSFAARPDVAWPPEAAIRSAYAENEMRLLTAFAAKRQEKGYTKEQLNFAASHAIIKATLRQLGLKYEVRRWT